MKGRFGEGGTFKKVQIKGEEGVYIVSKKFVVKDTDIPAKGRIVKCSFCSTTWRQMPTTI